MAENCKTCQKFSECNLPAKVVVGLLLEFGTDFQAMKDRLAEVPLIDTGLQAWLAEWVDERITNAEAQEG